MAPGEKYEAEEFEQVHIQEGDREPEDDSDDSVGIIADEIQDEDEESMNETEDEVAMIEEEVSPSNEFDRDPNFNEGDRAILIKIMNFLQANKNEVASMRADDTQSIKWHVDAAFAVHKDFKSHTGATLSLGKGIIFYVSKKEKVNMRSSTEAELAGVDDIILKVLCFIKLSTKDIDDVQPRIQVRSRQTVSDPPYLLHCTN